MACEAAAAFVWTRMAELPNKWVEDETSPASARAGYHERLKAELPELVELMGDAVDLGASLGLGGWSESEDTVAAVGVYRKLQHDGQAAVCLLKAGLVSQALVMQRVAFDALVILKLYRWDDTYRAEHEDQQQIFRRYGLKAAVKDRPRFGVANEDLPGIQAERLSIKTEIKDKDIVTPRTSELVDRADRAEHAALEGVDVGLNDLRPMYETASQLANLQAHSSIKAIEPYLASLQNGHGHEVFSDDVVCAGLNVVAMLLYAIRLLVGVVDGVAIPDELDSVAARHQALWRELEGRYGDRPAG